MENQFEIGSIVRLKSNYPFADFIFLVKGVDPDTCDLTYYSDKFEEFRSFGRFPKTALVHHVIEV